MRVFNTDGELLVLDANAAVDDTAYDEATWNGVTDKAASKNALRDKVEALIDDTAYGAGWNGVTDVAPSKNAVYDKIETIGGLVFTDYEYHTGLATAATYTPPAKTIYTINGEAFGATNINVEMYNAQDSSWREWITDETSPGLIIQDNSQYTRVKNDHDATLWIQLLGITWS